MKIEKPANSNYCATVVELKNIIPLANCENVVSTNIFGFTAVISKDSKVGDIGIVFPAETQLSDEYCYENNLYRHGNQNRDESVKGYMEDNRRVKAIKFRGNASNCLFMPLDSLKFSGVTPDMFKVGEEFDNLNGNEICKKYVVPTSPMRGNNVTDEKRFDRVDKKHMPEHMDSSNFFKWGDTIPNNSEIIVTQKLHGTSIRIGNTIAKRKLGYVERLLSRMGVSIQPYTFDYIYGSRKVIKDKNNPYQNHFYSEDIWTREGQKLIGILPKNYIVYGELIGWTGEGEIQKNYTYSIPKGQSELFVYRIAIVNEDGVITDLSWEHLKEFCKYHGLKYVPELWKGKKSDFKVADFIDKRFFEDGHKNCLLLGDNKDLVDEGVCIRIDTSTPTIFKAKSPKFLEHETRMLNEEIVDLESSQSNA